MLSVTLTQASPQIAVRMFVIVPAAGVSSQARGSNLFALKTEKLSSVEVRCHFDVAIASWKCVSSR